MNWVEKILTVHQKPQSKQLITHIFRPSLKKTKFGLATARAGNVIGGGDWSDNRIIPDCVRSIIKKNMIIRNPKSTRPWQHVLEPLSGYLLLAKNLYKNLTNFLALGILGQEKTRLRMFMKQQK